MTATCPVCGCDQPDGLLCHACTTALERDLAAVPDLVTQLDITASRQARIGAGGKGGLASERTPVHLGAIEAADNLAGVLTTWARDVLGSPASSPYPPRPAFHWAFVLAMRISEVRRHPKAAELVDEIGDAVRQARRVIDRPQDRAYLGTCMYQENEQATACEAELHASPTAREVRCKVCGITHDVAERRAWLLAHAADMLFTVKEAARMIGRIGHIDVTESSIRGYVHRKRIAYRPGVWVDDNGKEHKRIRLGDLLAVVVDEGERRHAG